MAKDDYAKNIFEHKDTDEDYDAGECCHDAQNPFAGHVHGVVANKVIVLHIFGENGLDVVVGEDARCRGIGEKLIRASIERAEAEGAKTIDLTSRPTRVEAHRLYRRCGFEIRETCVFRKKLQ